MPEQPYRAKAGGNRVRCCALEKAVTISSVCWARKSTKTKCRKKSKWKLLPKGERKQRKEKAFFL